MAEAEDLSALAGEFVLGTLDPRERAEAVARLAEDAEFAAAVREWEARLSPLALEAPEIEPPKPLRGAVMRRIAGDAPKSSNVLELRRKLSLWRGAAIGASALAAALTAAVIIMPLLWSGGPQGSYVAVLQPDGPGPAFVANIDIGDGTISVRRVGADTQQGKSWELWAIGGGRGQPQSLGVIDTGLRIDAGALGTADPAVLGNTVLAISLEPQGGSPTGQPTGPVMYTGKLVATE